MPLLVPPNSSLPIMSCEIFYKEGFGVFLPPSEKFQWLYIGDSNPVIFTHLFIKLVIKKRELLMHTLFFS